MLLCEYDDSPISVVYVWLQDSIVCTAHTSAMYLKRMNFEGKVYMVGNPSMAFECDALGIKYEGLGVSQGP